MPPAARLTDLHVCVAVQAPSPITSAATTVNIGFLPAAREGDATTCGGAIDDGSSNVFIEDEPAARLGDSTAPRGVIVTGCPTVFIGSTPEIDALVAAARTGIPFLECKSCQRAWAASQAQAGSGR
ncbi:PAAR domain-containing protein [Sorangium sp. So ce1151]